MQNLESGFLTSHGPHRKWTLTADGSRYFRIESTDFAMQGRATQAEFFRDSRFGKQYYKGSYFVQGKHDEYADAISASEFPEWLRAHSDLSDRQERR